MEFSFDVNQLFSEEITKVVGGRPKREADKSTNDIQVAEVINKLGVASAKAQGLRSPITTFFKLQLNRETIYVLKGLDEKSGKGVAVGMIKVGRRKLFLNDLCGAHHEVEPVSILDFYVHESKQRSGCGKKLFEAMLQGEGVQAFEVAIDRPSSKFLAFLKKHYDLQKAIYQANHYVVFKEFFKTCKDVGRDGSRRRQGLDTNSNPLTSNPTFKITQSIITQSNPFQDTRGSVASGTDTTTSKNISTGTATLTTDATSTSTNDRDHPSAIVHTSSTANPTLPGSRTDKKQDSKEPPPPPPLTDHRDTNFNWAPGQQHQQGSGCGPLQERLRYKQRNLNGSGYSWSRHHTGQNPIAVASHRAGETGGGGAGNASTLNFFGARHSQGPAIGHSSLTQASSEPCGFTRALEYSRHGMAAGVGRRGDVLSMGGGVGGILGLGGVGDRQPDYKSSSLKHQTSTYSNMGASRANYKLKDSWKQFLA